MSLKAKIRNIAKQKNIPAQVILQNYMFERLLVRLSASEYKEKFVLKGGMLVAAIVGLDNRATMDMDTTLKNLPLTPEAIRSALEDVCDITFDDGVAFEIGTISPIREDDIYGGYRVMLNAKFDTLLTPLSIDVSTGDAITPHAVQYNFSEIFDDEKSYELWAYNIETVMAEKVEPTINKASSNLKIMSFTILAKFIPASTLAHERHGGQTLRTVVEFAVAVTEMLHLESVGFVFLVVEGVQFVNGDLVELVEIRPPFPTAAEIVVEVRIGALLAELGRHIERAHR